MTDKLILAKDKKCVDCGKQAEVWFPCLDPDIQPHPYCKKCADKRKRGILMKICKIKGYYGA